MDLSADAGGVPVPDPNRPVFHDPRGRRRVVVRAGGAAVAGVGIAGIVMSGLLLSSSPTEVPMVPSRPGALAAEPFTTPLTDAPPAGRGTTAETVLGMGARAPAIPAPLAVAREDQSPASAEAPAQPTAAPGTPTDRLAPTSPPPVARPPVGTPPVADPPVTPPPSVTPPADPPAAPEPSTPPLPVVQPVVDAVQDVTDPIPVVGDLPILGR